MDRWTKKQLQEMTDIDFAICMLNERKRKLTNPYSPLAEKINQTIATLSEISEEQKRNES